MPNKQPSFAERCRAMQDAAHDLKEIAEIVGLEAIRMAARRSSASASVVPTNANGEPARARRLTNLLTYSTMSDIPPVASAERVRALNDALRTASELLAVLLARGQLVITRGVAGRGPAFVDRALAAVRAFDAFSADNDPYGEHDFGIFELDGVTLNWKIDLYERELVKRQSTENTSRSTAGIDRCTSASWRAKHQPSR